MIFLPSEFQWQSSLAKLAVILGIVLGEALRIWAVGYAGSATRTRGDEVPELVHGGPFRYVRNPLYIANIAMYTLAGFLFGFVSLSFIMLAYSCVQYTFIVAYEESLLKKTFGSAYGEYQKRVPRWWFRLTPGCPPSSHEFSFSRALRSERSTLILITLVSVIALLKN